MAKQRLHSGDLVRIAEDLGPSMSHFTRDCEALVIGSYRDVCAGHGGGEAEKHIYSLWLMPRNKKGYACSWYHDCQLTLIKKATLQDVRRVERLNRGEDE